MLNELNLLARSVKGFVRPPFVAPKIFGKINPNELKLCLQKDVVEISKKANNGMSKKVAKASLGRNIRPLNREVLQELADKNLSLNEMASALGVKVSTLRFHLNKYNIVSEAQKEFRVLKKYFTATTKEAKAEAFKEIDKYLEEIAKKEFKLKKGTTYADCLQDVRLRFFEIADKSRKEGVPFPKTILKETRESMPIAREQVETVKLSKLSKSQKNIPVEDRRIQMFETDDFEKYLWKHLQKHLCPREFKIFKEHKNNDKALDVIAESFDMTTERVRQLFQKTIEKVRKQYKIAEKLSELGL